MCCLYVSVWFDNYQWIYTSYVTNKLLHVSLCFNQCVYHIPHYTPKPHISWIVKAIVYKLQKILTADHIIY